MTRSPLVLSLGLVLAACGGSSAGGGGGPDSPPSADGAAGVDGTAPGTDGATPDAGGPDATPRSYSCGAFTEDPGWTLSEGYHAVVIADVADGLNQPVALTFAGGGFGGDLYVVNQGGATILRVDVVTGTAAPFTATWPVVPGLLTSITWDRARSLAGGLYVGDQGGDGDADSRVFAVDATGAATTFASAPGAGMDDIYSILVSPGGAYPPGLIVSGDTDGANIDWGVISAAGAIATFSDTAGAEGAAIDRAGTYGGGLFAARPAGGGYAGDDAISKIGGDGVAATPLATTLPGVHAPAFAPAGPFGGQLHAASWATGELFAISPAGAKTVLASGLTLTNYDGNILDFSPDGRVLMVADRGASRVVCIEPIP